MALTATFKTAAASGTDATVYTTTTGAFTPTANTLMIALVGSQNAGSAVSVIGNGVTYTLASAKAATIGGTASVFDIYTADSGAVPVSGEVAATWATNRGGCDITIIEIGGADLSGGSTAALLQTIDSTGTGVTGTAVLTTEAATDNRPLAWFTHSIAQAKSVRTNWTGLNDMNHASPPQGDASQWRSDAFEVNCSSTWATSGTWCGRAIEIKALASGGATIRETKRLLIGVGA